MTLHEAMIKAISDMGGGKQSISDVADYINSHNLYTRGDNSPVPINQISARINRYKQLFSRGDGFVWINSNHNY
jgi:hypothetical protein